MAMYKAKLDFSTMRRTLLTAYRKNAMRSMCTKQKLKNVSLALFSEKALKNKSIDEYFCSKVFSSVFASFVKRYLSVWKKIDKVSGLYEFVINNIEKILIDRVMKTTKFNKSHAARVLGISRNTLNSKLRSLNLQSYDR